MSIAPKCSCGHAPYYCNGNEHCYNKPLDIYKSYISLPPLELPDFKKLRKDCKLTLRKVEELTGISNAYLSQLENGIVNNPSYKVAVTLIHLYHNQYISTK